MRAELCDLKIRPCAGTRQSSQHISGKHLNGDPCGSGKTALTFKRFIPCERIVRAILSFNPRDVGLAEAFRATLFVYAPDIEVFFSPPVYEEHRSLSIERADAVLLFVGPQGLGETQSQQLGGVQRRQQRTPQFKVVPIVAAGGKIPSHLDLNL